MFFSTTTMNVYYGILVMVLVSGSWVCATQFLKATYITTEDTSKLSTADEFIFSAPFFTSWFCMMWTFLFFPVHLASITFSSWMGKKDNSTLILQEPFNKFFTKGVSFGILSHSLVQIPMLADQESSHPAASSSVSCLSPPTIST